MNALIYDIEIERAIPSKNHAPLEGIDYCQGWSDHANMGISVIGCYDYRQNCYRVFGQDNRLEFQRLIARRQLLVGFNNIAFDNPVIQATWPELSALAEPWFAENRCYDLLRELWVADGLAPEFAYPSHLGYGLDATCKMNFGIEKTGDGALAPVQWQRGEIASVVDYCLNDVRLTKRLFDAVLQGNPIQSPVTGKNLILREPELAPA